VAGREGGDGGGGRDGGLSFRRRPGRKGVKASLDLDSSSFNGWGALGEVALCRRTSRPFFARSSKKGVDVQVESEKPGACTYLWGSKCSELLSRWTNTGALDEYLLGNLGGAKIAGTRTGVGGKNSWVG